MHFQLPPTFEKITFFFIVLLVAIVKARASKDNWLTLSPEGDTREIK